MSKQTKCANYQKCQNDKEWDIMEFYEANDIEKIKIFLCENCYESISIQRKFSLKNGVMMNLKNS